MFNERFCNFQRRDEIGGAHVTKVLVANVTKHLVFKTSGNSGVIDQQIDWSSKVTLG